MTPSCSQLNNHNITNPVHLVADRLIPSQSVTSSTAERISTDERTDMNDDLERAIASAIAPFRHCNLILKTAAVADEPASDSRRKEKTVIADLVIQGAIKAGINTLLRRPHSQIPAAHLGYQPSARLSACQPAVLLEPSLRAIQPSAAKAAYTTRPKTRDAPIRLPPSCRDCRYNSPTISEYSFSIRLWVHRTTV